MHGPELCAFRKLNRATWSILTMSSVSRITARYFLDKHPKKKHHSRPQSVLSLSPSRQEQDRGLPRCCVSPVRNELLER